MSHSHSSYKKLWFVFFLSLFYMIAEILGGIWSGSLALLADAGHMAIDTAGIALGLFAMWISSKPPTSKKTYGYYRAEILAALLNGVFLLAISIWIVMEAWNRFSHPEPVQGNVMSWIAFGGLVVNVIGVKLLHAHSHDSLNMRGVWLHLISDLLGSVSAMIAGFLVWKWGWTIADTVSSLIISVFIWIGAWRLVSEAVHVLLEGVPARIDTEKIKTALEQVPGVRGVFDLHIWQVATGIPALSCHVAVAKEFSHPEMLRVLSQLLENEFSISHSTLQLEPEGFHQGSEHPNHCELKPHGHDR